MLLTQEEALGRLLDLAPIQLSEETVPLMSARGRVLAQAVRAVVDLPAWNVSMMDGYALATGCTDGACVEAAGVEADWPVSQRVTAGCSPQPLLAGTVARIFTGAPMPEGADAVIMQEDCLSDGNHVSFRRAPRSGDNVRRRGEDCLAGDVVLPAGWRVRAQDLALLAAVGASHVAVRKPLRVALLSTGNELVPPGQLPGPGQISDANKASLTGLLQALGCEVFDRGIVADNRPDVRQALLHAAGQADLVLTSGGVSVGDEDHVRAVVDELGQIDVWKVAIKPGKPFAFGHLQGKPFLGLPGNPVSAFVVFLLFVRPFILRMLGVIDQEPVHFSVKSGFSRPAGKRREWLRCQRVQRDGETQVVLCPNQGSASLTSLSAAEGLLDVPAGQPVTEGMWLEFYPMTGWVE